MARSLSVRVTRGVYLLVSSAQQVELEIEDEERARGTTLKRIEHYDTGDSNR